LRTLLILQLAYFAALLSPDGHLHDATLAFSSLLQI
jgi:hypothetical protein